MKRISWKQKTLDLEHELAGEKRCIQKLQETHEALKKKLHGRTNELTVLRLANELVESELRSTITVLEKYDDIAHWCVLEGTEKDFLLVGKEAWMGMQRGNALAHQWLDAYRQKQHEPT